MIRVSFNGGRGTWDQGMIEDAIAGRLWPVAADFEIGPPAPGCVYVIQGGVAAAKAPQDVPARALVIHTSDETQGYDATGHRTPASRLWLQYAYPLRPRQHDRRIVPGYPAGTREMLGGVPLVPLAERPRRWGFAGQAQNDSRRAMLAAVAGRKGGQARVSGGFSQGMPRADYLRWLAGCAIAPSPAGNHSPEGFRLYEALEAGCLPVAQRRMHGWPSDVDWWGYTLGEEPAFPIVEDWRELPAILDRYAGDALGVQAAANRAGAWWLSYKRRFALDLVEDVRAIGGDVMPAHPVTVLISSSPVPSHPSTAMIEDTVRRVRAYPALTKAEVLIMLDGVSPEDENRRPAYEEYIRRLVGLCNSHPDFAGCLPIVFDRHTHQAGMTIATLPRVRTPLLFFVEHDTYPHGDIDFPGIIRVLLDQPGAANAIRLHMFHTVLSEHRPLYPEREPRVVDGVPLLVTTDWSQRPHLARTDWYREMLRQYVPEGKAMWIEHALHGPIDATPWDAFRVCVYAPPGDMTRSGHADGRRLGVPDAA